MGSRKRKPGVNRALQWATTRKGYVPYYYVDHIADATFEGDTPNTPEEHAKLERLLIESLDYARYVETLKRVRSHPKNLLRLMNKRAADTQESKRNSSNIASYNAAVRRVMQRR